MAEKQAGRTQRGLVMGHLERISSAVFVKHKDVITDMVGGRNGIYALYRNNQPPTWLSLAHLELDRAVLAACAAVDPDGHWSEDWAEVWQPTGAGQPLPENHPLTARRHEIDQKVLENLLRMNLARAAEQDQ